MAVMKGEEKFIAGKTKFLLDNVFFGILALKLIYKKTNTVDYAATDGKYFLYNPRATDKLSPEEILFLIAHEVMHIVLLSHTRRGARDPLVWNMATDYVINLLLREMGFRLIEGCLIDDKYEGWTAERVYAHLIENPEEQPQTSNSEWNYGGVQDAGSNSFPGEDGEDGDGQGQPQSQGDDGEGGSIPHSQSHKEKMATAEDKVSKDVAAATIAAKKKAGEMHGALKRIIEEIFVPKADWKEILRRFINDRVFSEWDATSIHTRMLHQYGVISPRLGGEELRDIAIIVDTSGSVCQKELSQFAGEINDVLEGHDCTLTVVYNDTKIQDICTFESDDFPIHLEATGGGGTRMKPAFDWIQDELGDQIGCLILFSDSQLFDWDEIIVPEVPALMACTSRRVDADTPDWIEVVDISD